MSALVALLASACLYGSGTPDGSTAVPLHQNDAAQVASQTAEILAMDLPPANSKLVIVGPRACSKSDTFTPALHDALRRKGFAVAQDTTLNPDGHIVRYHLSEGIGTGVILRLEIDGTSSARLFDRRADGRLYPAPSATVMNRYDLEN